MGVLGMALLLMRKKSLQFQVVTIVGICFSLFQQVLFQKRLGTFESLMYLFAFFVVIPVLAKYRKDCERTEDFKTALWFLGISIAALIVTSGVAWELVLSQINSLSDRFVGTSRHGMRGIQGFIESVTASNERFDLAGKMFMDFSFLEILFGRGMGGYFLLDVALNPNAEVREVQYSSMYLDDVGDFGRRAIEIGWLMPVMKGGCIFGFVIFSGVVYSLLQLKSLRNDAISLAAWVWLAIEAVYLTQGGGFIMSSSFRVALLGICIGRCLSISTSKYLKSQATWIVKSRK
jgi:hypothetical protein